MGIGQIRMLPVKGSKEYKDEIDYFIKNGKLKPTRQEMFYTYATPTIFAITIIGLAIIYIIVK